VTTKDPDFVDLRLAGDHTSWTTRHTLQPITDGLLTTAGIVGGFRVLDLYCGRGDLSFSLAERVGETGSVVGIDPSADVIEAARMRATDGGYTNVEFHHASIENYCTSARFDAVVCRHVISGLRQPVAFLRSAAQLVRSRGILAVHEMDASRGVRSTPPIPDLRTVDDIIGRTLDRLGVLPDAGGRLVDLFDEAGLPLPSLSAQSIVSSGLDGSAFALTASLLTSLLPHLTRDDVEILQFATLEDRLRQSALQLLSQVEFIPQICAWVRIE
jgi:SAM-dependent methyltransferase